jgi:predicted phage tail protein
MNGERLVEVHLHGALGEQFGPRHYFNVATPGEAARALSANYPEFRAAFLANPVYDVMVDGDWRDGLAAATFPVSREVHFVPRTEGQAFLPVLLIPALTTTFGAVGAQIIGSLIVTGLMMGVSYLLNKSGDKDKETDDKSESYAFTGADNVAQQGVAVPVIYGRVHVGSVVASAGLETGDQVNITGAITQMGGPDVPVPIYPALARPGDPEIVLQALGPPDARIERLGPVGWDYVGARAFIEADGYRRWLDIFVSPDHVEAWDYWRGFGPYNERVFLP